VGERRQQVGRALHDQVVGCQQQADEQGGAQHQVRAGGAEVGLEERGRADAQDAALPLGQAVVGAGLELVDRRRERDGQQDQPHRPHPRVAHPVLGHEQHDAQAAEQQDRERPLPHEQEQPVGDDGPGRAAQVGGRRVRVDGVAGPVGRVEAGDRQQQEQPPAHRHRGRDPTTPKVKTFHMNAVGS
jgi:hypothetical protein